MRRNPITGPTIAIASIGIMFFVLSFYIFEWNETQLDLAYLARQSIDTTNVPNPPSGDNRLISITAPIQANTSPGDTAFLTSGRYVAIDRLTEEYQRQENSPDPQPSTTTNSQPRSPNNPTAKNNRTVRSPRPNSTADRAINLGTWKEREHQFYKISSALVGRYQLDLSQFTYLTNSLSSCQNRSKSFSFPIPLNNVALTLPVDGYLNPGDWIPMPANPNLPRLRADLHRSPHYIFAGMGSPDTPSIGDTRTCYVGLADGAIVTVFGSIANAASPLEHRDRSIVVHRDRDRPLLRLVAGSRLEAIEILSNQYQMVRWLSRVGGFLCTWGGLGLMATPLSIRNRLITTLDNAYFYHYFWPALGLSLMSAITTFFSHSVIPALPISCVFLLFVLLRDRLWHSNRRRY